MLLSCRAVRRCCAAANGGAAACLRRSFASSSSSSSAASAASASAASAAAASASAPLSPFSHTPIRAPNLFHAAGEDQFRPSVPQQAVAPPPKQGRGAAPEPFSMQVVFLGYGVGKFELEMLRAAPQLLPEGGRPPPPPGSFVFTPKAPSFDLSAHAPTPSAASQEGLKSSWASQQSSGVGGLKSHGSGASDPRFSPELSLGSARLPHADPAALQSLARGVTPAAAASSKAPVDISAASLMPLNTRIVVHSSVVVYQNCAFCWSPEVFEDVSVESLQFLTTLTPRPELILIGCGSDIRFRLPVAVQEFLASMRIGFELMDSGNAIATYNILTDEGRTVLAAMIKRPVPVIVPRKLSRSEEMRQKLGYWTN